MSRETPSQSVDKINQVISIIVPIYNEEWCLYPLYGKFKRASKDMQEKWEVIFVNDGSTDGSKERLIELEKLDDRVEVIHLRRNYGTSQALQAGFDNAKGDFIVTISGNLQNEPKEIPYLIEELKQGYDICVGWRHDSGKTNIRDRRGFIDTRYWLSRIVPKVTGVDLNDYSCSLRAYRRSAVQGMRLSGRLERYIPVFGFWKGGKIKEIPVINHPRSHGHGKQESFTKTTMKTLLDLMLLRFMERYSERPIYVFGSLGVAGIVLSLVFLFVAIYNKIQHSISLIETPLPLVSVLCFLTGLLLLVLGIMTEFIARLHATVLDKKDYEVDDVRDQ